MFRIRLKSRAKYGIRQSLNDPLKLSPGKTDFLTRSDGDEETTPVGCNHDPSGTRGHPFPVLGRDGNHSGGSDKWKGEEVENEEGGRRTSLGGPAFVKEKNRGDTI